jgi:hypothetical protein
MSDHKNLITKNKKLPLSKMHKKAPEVGSRNTENTKYRGIEDYYLKIL